MRRFLFALTLAVLPPAAATAETAGVFADYDEMRATLDRLVTTRSIRDMMTSFGSNVMTAQDLTALEVQVRNLYPNDFIDGAVMNEGSMAGGFRQQLLAYWDAEYNYFFVHLILHEREDEIVAVRMSFNSDIEVFLSLF